jgi:hypothetical protein
MEALRTDIKFVSWESRLDPFSFPAIAEEMYQNSKNRKLHPLSFYERKQMPGEVHFRDLPASTAYKCNVMLESKMQCQERAAIEYFSVDNPSVNPTDRNIKRDNHICKHHFAVERALNEAEGTKYIAYTEDGMAKMDENKETYQPPQK